jgi:hypothetical protein
MVAGRLNFSGIAIETQVVPSMVSWDTPTLCPLYIPAYYSQVELIKQINYWDIR